MRVQFASRLLVISVWTFSVDPLGVLAQKSRPALVQKFGEDSSFWENRDVRCEGVCGETFLDVEPFLKRDQKSQCTAGDPVRVRTAYEYKTCYIAHSCTRKTFHWPLCEEIGGKPKPDLEYERCYFCAPAFQKYHESIKPCAAVDLALAENFLVELNEFKANCPCYTAGPGGTPACGAVHLRLSMFITALCVLFYFLL